MGRLRRLVRAGAWSALAVSTLLVLGAPAHAAPAKGSSIDACSLITSDDLAALTSPAALDRTDELSAKNCLYYLDDGSTINLFVDKASEFATAKAGVKKAKKVSGLPSGYAGEFFGDSQVGFKSGSNAIRVVSTKVELPDLVVVAKAIKQHL